MEKPVTTNADLQALVRAAFPQGRVWTQDNQFHIATGLQAKYTDEDEFGDKWGAAGNEFLETWQG